MVNKGNHPPKWPQFRLVKYYYFTQWNHRFRFGSTNTPSGPRIGQADKYFGHAPRRIGRFLERRTPSDRTTPGIKKNVEVVEDIPKIIEEIMEIFSGNQRVILMKSKITEFHKCRYGRYGTHEDIGYTNLLRCFLLEFPDRNGHFFYNYVNLPEGNCSLYRCSLTRVTLGYTIIIILQAKVDWKIVFPSSFMGSGVRF